MLCCVCFICDILCGDTAYAIADRRVIRKIPTLIVTQKGRNVNNHLVLRRIRRTAFKTQIRHTPVSENTASHSGAIFMIARMMITALTISEKVMFALTVEIVLRASRTARGREERFSELSTISADSIAASEPSPIAMPQVARLPEPSWRPIN